MKKHEILQKNVDNYSEPLYNNGVRNGGIGEVVNTLDCGSSMRGFESHISPHYMNLYQSCYGCSKVNRDLFTFFSLL